VGLHVARAKSTTRSAGRVANEARPRAIYLIPLSALVAKVEYRWLGTHPTMRQKISRSCLRVLTAARTHHHGYRRTALRLRSVGVQDTHRERRAGHSAGISQSTVLRSVSLHDLHVDADTEQRHDLIVKPRHRLFIYQAKTVWRGARNCWSKARHLVERVYSARCKTAASSLLPAAV